MAIYRIFPEKDATLYSRYEASNTGLDEILEISSFYLGSSSFANRTVIQFNNSEIEDVIESKISPTVIAGGQMEFSASIKLYLAEGEEVPTGYAIEASPLYDSWDTGTGKYGDNPVNKTGVSWFYTKPGIRWTNPTPANTAASYNSGSVAIGGVWYTGSYGINLVHFQSHSTVSTHDIDLDVTPSVKLHYSQSQGLTGITNNGFILKLNSVNEFQTGSLTFLKYFSSNTHTIYPPCLEFKWDDFVTSSLVATRAVTDPTCIVGIKNAKDRYTDEGKYRFRLNVRPKYPTRTFVTSSNYTTQYYLPTASYWGLRDENTEEMVVDFDTTYTKISSDNTSNYFDVYMNGLQPERHYRLLIKTTIDGSTSVLDNGVTFKVVRNG